MDHHVDEDRAVVGKMADKKTHSSGVIELRTARELEDVMMGEFPLTFLAFLRKGSTRCVDLKRRLESAAASNPETRYFTADEKFVKAFDEEFEFETESFPSIFKLTASSGGGGGGEKAVKVKEVGADEFF